MIKIDMNGFKRKFLSCWFYVKYKESDMYTDGRFFPLKYLYIAPYDCSMSLNRILLNPLISVYLSFSSTITMPLTIYEMEM